MFRTTSNPICINIHHICIVDNPILSFADGIFNDVDCFRSTNGPPVLLFFRRRGCKLTETEHKNKNKNCRDDIMFVVGLMDCAAFTQSEEDQHHRRREEDNLEIQEREIEDDVGPPSRRHSMDMSKGHPEGAPIESEPTARTLDAGGEQRAACFGAPLGHPSTGGPIHLFAI